MLYKLTDKNGKTQAGKPDECQWGENVTHKAKKRGRELCTREVVHAYTDPYLAVFHNPIGAAFNEETMRMWEARGRVVSKDWGKVGCKSLTTLAKIPCPEMTEEQRVEIAIRCAIKVYKEPGFIKWASEWLDGTGRSSAAARDAGAAARDAEAARNAWGAKERVKFFAEAAAEAAARAAAEAAAEGGAAAEAAAEAAARAAAALDVVKIIHEVMGKC